MSNYAGVDWASEKHDVVVAERGGRGAVGGPRSRTMRRGCGRCAARSVRMKVTLVAIERPDGLLVERLLDAGLRLLPLHPNQVAAARPGSGRRAGSPTGSTRSCCASWRAPTIIASGCSSPTATRPRRCGR